MSKYEKIPKSILHILSETYAMTLATVEPDNNLGATPLFFAPVNGISLVFLSQPSSPHCTNLLHVPSCGAGLYPDVRRWMLIRGLQLKGHAVALDGEDARTR